MKKTNIISLIGLSFISASCVMDGEVTIFGWVFLIVVVGVIIVFALDNKENKEDEAKKQEWRKKMTEGAEIRRQEQEDKRRCYEAQLRSLESNTGRADKTIVIGENDLNQEIRVYAPSREVFILGRTYPFQKILSCSFTDNVNVKKGQTTIKSVGTTKADNANTIKRAVVGGLIGGVAGAAVGGTTGKKNTTTTSVVSQGNDTTVHDYTVWIGLQDIVTPMIEIHIGKDSRKVNEVVALMNAIIAGNNE